MMIKRRPNNFFGSFLSPFFQGHFSLITLVFARDESSRLFNPITKQAISVHERTGGHIKNSIQDVDDACMGSARTFSCNRAQKNLKLKCHRAFTHSIVTQLAINSQPFIISIFTLSSPYSHSCSTQFSSAIPNRPHSTSTELQFTPNFYYTVILTQINLILSNLYNCF